MNDADRYIPIKDKPGWRYDPASGLDYYSSDWLGDAVNPHRTPLPLDRIDEARVDYAGSPIVTTLDGRELRHDPEGARVIQLQRNTVPEDGDIGGTLSINPGLMLRTLALDGFNSAIRNMEKLIERIRDVDPVDAEIVRVRLRETEILRSKFEGDGVTL